MASKKLADSTLYHVSPKGFWKKFRTCLPLLRNPVRRLNDMSAGDATVVNPEISTGLPIPSLNRYPQPASRPEQYSTPATKGARSVG